MLSIVLAWETFKDWLAGTLRVTHWTLHVVLGVLMLLAFSRLFRRPLSSPILLVPIAGSRVDQ